MEDTRKILSERERFYELPDLVRLHIPRWKRIDELFVMHLLRSGLDVEIRRDGVWMVQR